MEYWKGIIYRKEEQDFLRSVGTIAYVYVKGGYVTIYCKARIILFIHCAVFFLSPSSHEVIGGDLCLSHYAHVYITSILSYFYTHLQLCSSFMAIPHHTHLNFVFNVRST